ncbi:MAG: DHH family phosphoesterase [Candidatus Thorarchaeota archaeon]|nr:DHH family phosphoesterase [Candidatus Thorarchaeota archaeon]
MNLRSLLSESKSPLILGHQNADPDAVCSMIAFSKLFKFINPDGNPILMADDLSRLSQQVIESFAPDSHILEPSIVDYDLAVLMDTNSRFQLGLIYQEFLQNPDRTVVIDHHEYNPETETLSKHLFVRTDRYSTCEMMVPIFEELEAPLDPMIANLLLTGMIFDTRRFFFADLNTLQTVTKLIESGADYERCVRSLQVRPDRSERIARLKAAGRVRVFLIGYWIIAVSKIRSFEASVCRGLIDMGADVAIVGGKPSKSAIRISSRSTREFSEKTKISLGKDVMEPLGSLIEGEGGGHVNAAGANGKKNLDEAISKSVELIRHLVENISSSSIES